MTEETAKIQMRYSDIYNLLRLGQVGVAPRMPRPNEVHVKFWTGHILYYLLA
jgi:hypothetical protein